MMLSDNQIGQRTVGPERDFTETYLHYLRRTPTPAPIPKVVDPKIEINRGSDKLPAWHYNETKAHFKPADPEKIKEILHGYYLQGVTPKELTAKYLMYRRSTIYSWLKGHNTKARKLLAEIGIEPVNNIIGHYTYQEYRYHETH